MLLVTVVGESDLSEQVEAQHAEDHDPQDDEQPRLSRPQ